MNLQQKRTSDWGCLGELGSSRAAWPITAPHVYYDKNLQLSDFCESTAHFDSLI